jgi:predicted ATP-dependent endonuclease of OLD family
LGTDHPNFCCLTIKAYLMRYTSFVIENFKGIQDLKLDLGGNPASKVSILVGLNESGKTTIMEALSFFYENIRDINDTPLALHPSGIIDNHSLIPKNRKDNFTDKTKILAFVEMDEQEVDLLRKVLKEKGFHATDIDPVMNMSFEFSFENSSFKKRTHYWNPKIQGKDGRKRTVEKLGQKHTAWSAAYEFTKKHIPPIIYYPNFLFEFPDSIYLEEFPEEGREQAFYRLLLQDILDSLSNPLDLKTHIIERVKSVTRPNRESLTSVLNKMGAQITKLVFSENLSVFRTDTSNKSIAVSYPQSDEKNEALYVELQLKDGEDSYYIRERSLGFRWFFTFLLFTQFRVHRSQVNTNLVFLFDEPASNLHQTAQQRLAGALDELTKSKVSVIYSTHSHHLINPKWLENTFIVRNKALEYEKGDLDTFKPTNIEVQKYRAFVTHHPNQITYYQPILDVLEYRPSNLETIKDAIMVEGKNDFYTLSYFQDVIIKSKERVPLIPGMGGSKLDVAIQLYCGWGKQFIVLLDSDKAGKKEKARYEENFGNIVDNRIFILADIDSAWEGFATEKIFTGNDSLTIQQSVFPEEKKFNKKLFNLAIQENFAKGNAVSISKITIDRFNKILKFLYISLASKT